MKRIVNTDRIELNLAKTYPQERAVLKPRGLWYGIDNEWIEWCKNNMVHRVKKKIIELEDINLSKILIIENFKQLKVFSEEFSYKVDPYVNYINWEKISKKYSGIEIQNYYKIKEKESFPDLDNIWFWGWDVSSGCIWDLSIIKSFKYYEI